ncbi:MAG: hypothetical protein OQK55_04705 [Thermoanaerobaculales bacterium]|nr:hypothetical protein [Thermoanaerobaculales bacterium]
MIRCSRLAGPVLGVAVTVCVGGLGLHAARDWHRHGELGAGFFHLHFHVGEHGHEHPADGDHDHEDPANAKRQRSAVLTIAQALHNDASAASMVTPREPAPERTLIGRVILPRSNEGPSFANPRAPPA